MNTNQNRPATFKWHGRLCSLSRLAVVLLLGTASGPPPFVVAAAVSESKAGPPGSSGGIGGRRSFRQLLLGKLEVADEKKSGETLSVVGGGHGPVTALMDTLEDVHDGFQGVGPEGTSKLDGDIEGGDLDGASSIGLRDELNHEDEALDDGINKLASLLNFLSGNNNNSNKKKNKNDKNEVVLAGEVFVHDVAEGSASSLSHDVEDKKHTTKNKPCDIVGLVVYLFALALSVYTVTYSSNSESTKKKGRKSGTSPKRVLAYSFRGIMVIGIVVLVAVSLGLKASGHQSIDVSYGKGDIEAGLGDTTNIRPSYEDSETKVAKTIKPFTLGRGMKELDDMSRSLRGSASKDIDSADVWRRLKDVTSSYLASIQVIQSHTNDGTMEKAAAALKSVVGDTNELAGAGSKSELGTVTEFSAMLDAGTPGGITSDARLSDLRDAPDDQLAHFIRPESINELVDNTQSFLDVLEGIDLSSARPNPRKGRKASREKSAPQGGESKFNFDFQGQASGFHSRSGFHSEFNHQFFHHDFHTHSFMKHMARHRHKALQGNHRTGLGKLSSFFEKDEIIMAKHELRQNALGNDVCTETCDDDDWDCNCGNLFTCIDKLTEYDLAILMAGGFVDTSEDNFGNFSVSAENLNLYSADEGVKDKLASLKVDALKDRTLPHCQAVLGQLFTACDPSGEKVCENPNVESFHLSTEQVCAGVNTPTKLLFEAIGDEFDGFVDESVDYKCEPFSYDICKDFVVEFDRLYEAAAKNGFADPVSSNPMRRNSATSLQNKNTSEIFDYVQFPIEYWYTSNETTGVIDRTDFSFSSVTDKFALVNPNTGLALGVEGDDGDCSPAWGQDNNFGPRVIIHDYDSSDDRQHWTLTSNGEIKSVACDMLLTPEDDDAEECTVGSRLILRSSGGLTTQTWKIGVDGTIALDVDCSEYYLPNLVISEIEDDDTDTMKDNRAYVSFINQATDMALSVKTVCDRTTSAWTQETFMEELNQHDLTPEQTEIAIKAHEKITRELDAILAKHRSVQTKQEMEASTKEETGRRLTKEDDPTPPPTPSPTPAPSKNPTKSPTLSPSDSPSEAPSQLPRVDLQTYDETDPTQQFVLIKGWGDYVWIYSPYCSGVVGTHRLVMVPRDSSEGHEGQLAELRNLDWTFIANLLGLFGTDEWRWTVEGDGVIALATADEELEKVLSIDEDATYKPGDMAFTDLYVYENEGETWKNTWTVVSSNAVLLGEAGSEDQVWKAEFVDPYINYALLPGFPGTLNGDGCLDSTEEPELAKAAMHRCDESMSLLMGSDTSLGTLRAITDLLEEHGMERMPGECCFDTPTTNDDYFGVEYDPLSMNCTNTGPWHLRISQEACENAGGHWFRTPCVTLKEALDERPYRFDLDNPVDGDCQDTLEQMNVAFVSISIDHANFTYDDDAVGCVQFCRDLPGYTGQIAMMVENTTGSSGADTCSCLYQDGMAPNSAEVPEYATLSPAKFYLTNPADGTTLGLKSNYDCTADEISIEVQTNVGSSRQQFQLSYNHHIISVACSEMVLTADCTDQSGGGLSFKNISYTQESDDSQRWEFGSDGTVTNVKCPEMQITSFQDNPGVIESEYFAMVNPTTGMAMEISALSLVENLTVTIDSNWSASDHPDDSVTDPYPGKYFTFDDAEWVGPFESYVDGNKTFVNQWRNGELIWSGEVILYELFEYEPTGFCSTANNGCDTGKPIFNGNRAAGCKDEWWCDTTPPPVPAHGMRADSSADDDFETGDQLSPMIGTCGRDVLNYPPHVEMQTLVMGRPSQQFYLGDNGAITSLMCPDLALAISDVVTSNYTCDSDSNSTGSNEPITIRIRSLEHASEWQFNEDKSVESTLCPGKIIDINKTGLLSAAVGALPLLSESEGSSYRKWNMNHTSFKLLSGPVSFVNPSSGYALSVDDDVCANSTALITQVDDYTSINQQFYLGSGGALHSLMCPGLVVSMGTDVNHDCMDGYLTLQPAAGEDNTKWTFDSDGSMHNVHCSEYVIDIGSVVVGSKITISQHSQSDGQSWKKVNTRLLNATDAAAAGWNQNWTVSFVDEGDSSSSLHDIPTAGLPRTCYLPNDAFSVSFEDFSQTLDIDDASDEEKCQDTREALGYDRDHPFDTEVVDTYHDYECDIHFTGTDHMADAAFTGPPVFTEVEFEAPEYPDDPELTFDELPVHSEFKLPDLNDGTSEYDAFTNLLRAQLILGEAKGMVDDGYGYMKDLADTLCDTQDNKFCIPVFNPIFPLPGGFGGCTSIFAKSICNLVKLALISAGFVLVKAADIADIVMNHVIFEATDTDYDAADTNDAAIATMNNLKTFDGYVHDSLQVINKNIFKQHTEMRKHLQDRHQDMVTDLVDFLEQSTNILGNQFTVTNEWVEQIACDTTGYNDSIDSCPTGEDGKFLDVDKWPEGTTVPLWNKMNRIETQGKQLHDTMNDIQKFLLFEASGSRGNNLPVEIEVDTKTTLNAGKNEKALGIQMVDRELNDETGKMDKVDAVESKVDAVESKVNSVEAKVDKLSADMKQMMSKITEVLEQNAKVN